MKNKTVKEKVEGIFKRIAIDGIYYKSDIQKIDKLYRKELLKDKKQPIRERLMKQFLKENPMVLADDVPDRFADWIGEKQANING